MAADASAYEALGLEPGADAAAVERAYKRLIKQFHPDRAGGDSRRAAEINRAYRELRPSSGRGSLELDDLHDEGRRQDRWIKGALWLGAGLLLLVLVTGPGRGLFASAPAPLRLGQAPSIVIDANPMDQPLALAAIDQAIAEAVQLSRTADELALAEASRDCHRRMHSAPALARLDRCAAFDDAVVQLQDRDPLRNGGPFSQLAVTGRQMSAATLLSNDYLAIDGRLSRIRLHVELALAPKTVEPAPEPPVDAG